MYRDAGGVPLLRYERITLVNKSDLRPAAASRIRTRARYSERKTRKVEINACIFMEETGYGNRLWWKPPKIMFKELSTACRVPDISLYPGSFSFGARRMNLFRRAGKER